MSATYPAGSTAEDYQRLADLGRALRPLLDPAVLVRAAGGLPLLWLNVTYPVGTLPAGLLDAVIGEFDLRALGEFTEP
ncbi:hypothetical protein ACFXOQ_36475 [Streptomyces californicus]|uniref:hypothetical protein n=1 Tax=Streptomyces californicus TaxID=67351 RepID=UPI003691EDD0